MDSIILSISILAAFLLGSWVTYRSMLHKDPVRFIDREEELPEIISPYDLEQKNREVKVKL
jgi:hypothetical protein